jgi:hypothetical protein
LADYINSQFPGDEYTLNCESIEIDFYSDGVSASKYQVTKVVLTNKWRHQEKLLQTSKDLKRENMGLVFNYF